MPAPSTPTRILSITPRRDLLKRAWTRLCDAWTSRVPAWRTHSALGALGLALATAPAARAQVAYVEPPDLSANLNAPTPVGTLTAGLSTVNGTMSGTWNTAGNRTGDDADAFSFMVPSGLVVTGIQIFVTNFVCNNCLDRVRSLNGEIGSVDFTGNGTFTLPLSGPLTAGTYNTQTFMTQRSLGIAGSSSFSYQFRITAIPANNDSCQFATAINLGATPFNNATATTDGLPHATACNFSSNPSIAKDLWYTFTPALTGALTVSTCGSTFDTEVNVYTGTACPGSDATLLACSDNFAGCGTQSQVVFTANAGQTYLIRVGGQDGSSASGPGTLTLSQSTTGACCNRWTGDCVADTPANCIARGLRFDGFGSTCSPTTCKACPADFNGVSGISVQDVFDFLAAWFAGC